ncbi:MAG TPA: zinc-dependent alcohol dehydrogenase [Candidatus Limnocylindrales bacterium]|nr:zinc-dependent alcohol dehydrogenase [Candidatus Limnocylindrales bacterium]
MKAVTWQGKRSVSVDEVPDPVIQAPTDIIIKVTSTCICGSDLHLYELLGSVMGKGDILGHEPMGIVAEVGAQVTNVRVGDRVVIPFNISCGHCFMCKQGLQSQCETTQVRNQGRGAALFGYSKLYGEVPGGQAEYLRVPHGDYGPIKIPEGPSDDRFVYLSDVLPTAWQAVQYAAVPENGSVVVFGLGPIGDMSARIAKHLGAAKVIGIDLVAERLERAKRRGIETIDLREHDDATLTDIIMDKTNGRGADSVIDAVGTEAHGSPFGKITQQMTTFMPDFAAEKLIKNAAIDRMSVLYHAINAVRRGGTISISGVYAGKLDPIPMDTLFDKQVQIRMGQANVRRWSDDILPLLNDSDPLGVDDFATHHLPLAEAAHAYEIFQKKEDGAIKIILQP